MAGQRRVPAGGGAWGLLSVTVALMAHGALGCWAEEPTQPGESLSSGFAVPLEQAVKAQLVAEHASVPPGGKTRLAVVLDITPEWHIYAPNPGDAGLPTEVRWNGPEGATFGPIAWPTPQQFLDPGDIKTFGYTGQLVLVSELIAPSAGETELPVRATVTWLSCKDICIPGNAQLELILPVLPSVQAPSAHTKFFEHTPE